MTIVAVALLQAEYISRQMTALNTEGIAREMGDSSQEFVWSIGNSVREEEASKGGRGKLDLISTMIGRDTFGNETALQLSMPVWQCNSERLN